jgi:hypothetical protein
MPPYAWKQSLHLLPDTGNMHLRRMQHTLHKKCAQTPHVSRKRECVRCQHKCSGRLQALSAGPPRWHSSTGCKVTTGHSMRTSGLTGCNRARPTAGEKGLLLVPTRTRQHVCLSWSGNRLPSPRRIIGRYSHNPVAFTADHKAMHRHVPSNHRRSPHHLAPPPWAALGTGRMSDRYVGCLHPDRLVPGYLKARFPLVSSRPYTLEASQPWNTVMAHPT